MGLTLEVKKKLLELIKFISSIASEYRSTQNKHIYKLGVWYTPVIPALKGWRSEY